MKLFRRSAFISAGVFVFLMLIFKPFSHAFLFSCEQASAIIAGTYENKYH